MPSLPDDVVEKTREKYVEAFRRLTGRELVSLALPGSPEERMISERLEKLVEEMVDKGVHFEDAVREFEKRFIARVLGAATAASRRPPTRSACTATRSPARWSEYRIKRRAG